MRSREEVAELVMNLYDRLDTQFDGAQVLDAVLVVELEDPEFTVNVEDGTEEGRDVPETIVLMESTTDRLVIQAGMVEFARRTMFRGGAEEEDDDER